jgi:hypothetical protein
MATRKKNGWLVAGLVAVTSTAVVVYGILTQDQSPKKTSTPPDPELYFDDSPSPPLLGSSLCYGSYPAPSNGPLSPEVLALMNSAARAYVTPPNGKRISHDVKGNVYVFQPGTTRLTPQGQVAAFRGALALLAKPYRSTNSITTRKVLKQMMPECNWDADLWPAFGRDSFSQLEYNLWTSVWYLVQAAAHQIGYKVGGTNPSRNLMVPKPSGGPGLVIGRGFLELPDVGTPGKMSLEPGRRVELLVGDYKKGQWPRPPFFHAEPVIARVIDSAGGRPTVEVLSTFRSNDVAPKFAHRHGFGVGRRLKLPGSGTTAIRKIFPSGVT